MADQIDGERVLRRTQELLSALSDGGQSEAIAKAIACGIFSQANSDGFRSALALLNRIDEECGRTSNKNDVLIALTLALGNAIAEINPGGSVRNSYVATVTVLATCTGCDVIAGYLSTVRAMRKRDIDAHQRIMLETAESFGRA